MGCCAVENKKPKNVNANVPPKETEINADQNEQAQQEEPKLKAAAKPIQNVEENKNNNNNEPKKMKFYIGNYDNSPLLDESKNDDELLKDIFNELNIEKNRDYDLLDKNGEKLNDKLDLKVKDIFHGESPIELSVKYKGLEIPKDIKQAYINDSKLIGSLILDNPEYFGLVTLETDTLKTNQVKFNLEENDYLKKFNSFSAFCNGNKKIYLSGGETSTDPANSTTFADFIEIDLEQNDPNNLVYRNLPNLNEARTWHSMIFIPKKYVFIVSGTNIKSVELFDTEKNEIKIDSYLNEARSECTLALVNDLYLYAFCGFLLHQTFVNTIERCNLGRENRKWEIVNYKLENGIQFNPSFFAVGYLNDDILLFGGNENEEDKNKNYLLKNGEILEEFYNNENIVGVYREKLFHPINNETSALIPLLSNNVEVCYLKNSNKTVTKEIYNDENEKY
jgi:hypothetical protein